MKNLVLLATLWLAAAALCAASGPTVSAVPDRSKPMVLEMDVWGESDLSGIVINTRKNVWTPIRPQQRLSRKPQWDTLQFRIPPEALDKERVVQHLGFGGADSQIWVAAIRVKGDKQNSTKETP